MSSSYSTPARSNPSSPTKPKSSNSNPPLFTPLMQDAQARGKNPYDPALGFDTDSDSCYESIDGRFDAYGNDTYENIQKRRMAAIILDNPELLMMHSQARFDSIPGTRNHFTKILCGYFDENDKDASMEPPPEKEEKKDKSRCTPKK